MLSFQGFTATLGEGKNAGIAVSFDVAPINSFAVDSQVFKRGLASQADGSFSLPASPYQSRKKERDNRQHSSAFFDHPIHTLGFISMKRSKIGNR
jgi:hypothetical protein